MKTSLPHWNEVIRPKNNTAYLKHGPEGDTEDIIAVILYADTQSAAFILRAGAEKLRGENDLETCRNIWRFVKTNNRYRADSRGHERVQSPGSLFSTGSGDCKSLSISEAALLRALGIPFRFRFVSWQPGGFSHVYVVAKVGGRLVPMDAVHTAFDDEARYFRKSDRWPDDQAKISGPDEKTGSNILKTVAISVAATLATHYILKRLRKRGRKRKKQQQHAD